MFEAIIAATEKRFRQRDSERRGTRRLLERSDILGANDPLQVERRLKHIGIPPRVVRAIIGREPVGDVVKENHLDERVAQFEAMNLGLERVLGDNDLIGVSFLERGWQSVKSVGLIANAETRRGFGTGFLVSPRLLMTNHHVLRSHQEAARSVAMFDYQVNASGAMLTPVVFRLNPDSLFLADQDLDYALVAVEPRSADGPDLDSFGYLQLQEDENLLRGDLVNIIQHPNGEFKQLALRENMVIDVLDQFVHYQTDTAPGSSGSPVFNDEWNVVCVHHSGVPKRNENRQILARDGSIWSKDMGEDRIAWEANEGTLVGQIINHLHRSTTTLSQSERELLATVPVLGSRTVQNHRPESDKPVGPAEQSQGYQFRLPLEIVINVDPAGVAAQIRNPRGT